MKTVSHSAIYRCAARIATEVVRPVGEVVDKLITAHERLGIQVDLTDGTELDFASHGTSPHRTTQTWPLQPQ